MAEEPDKIILEPEVPVVVEEPVVIIKEDAPVKEETITVSPYVERYADKLKNDLGAKYSAKLDKLAVEQRIDAMEIVLETLKKSDPLVKGEGQVPLNVPATKTTGPKTILDLQKESGYANKLRDAGSYMGIAKKLYK